jgi:ENTS family enterobactin (siderophore) exporter
VVAATCIAVGVSPWFGLVLGAILAMGVGDGLSLVANQGIMQRRTPDAVRSRVSGAMDTFVHGGLALSYVVGGPVVAALGPRAAYVLGGVAALIGVVIAGVGLRAARMDWGPKASPQAAHEASELLIP